MSTGRASRAAAALATLAGAVLMAPPAQAAQYAIDVHVDGVTGGGNYAPKSFSWGEPFEVTFTHPTDGSTAALMALARDKRDCGNAVLHSTTSGVAVITLQMSGVHVESVRESDSASASDTTPEETVVLRFRRVTYTFQPVNVVGQKNGPPVTFTWGEGPR